MLILTRRSQMASCMNRFISCLLVLAMVISLPSCLLLKKKGKKKEKQQITATGQPPSVPQALPAATVPAEGNAEINTQLIAQLMPLWERSTPYRTFSGKAKVSLQSSAISADFSANFRIAKDSLVWVHVTALGGLYPVARMLVTRDSFFMVDYTQKQITMIPLTEVGKVFPVEVQLWQLQNLLVGAPISDGAIKSAETKDSIWVLNTEDADFMQQLSYSKIDSNMVTGNLQMRKQTGQQALLTYANYETVNNRKLSVYRTVNVQNGINVYNLEMDIVNPEFDKELDYSFSLPKNYTIKAIK